MEKLTTTGMKVACLYLRFSDEKQSGGTSIDVQEEYCKNYCKIEGLTVLDTAKNEAISANKKNEQRIVDLIDYCKERRGKFDVLVVYKLDRFARDQYQHHFIKRELLRMGIHLRSATERIDESPSGKLTEGVLAALNEYDNSVRAERVKAAMWRRVEEGLWPWQPPTGYMSVRKKDEKLSVHEPDPNLAHFVTEIFNEYSTNTVTQAELSHKYHSMKLKDYKGRVVVLSPQSIYNLLVNPYYAGKLKHGGEKLVDGKHTPLVSYTLFLKCQAILQGKSNNAIGPRQYDNPDFPLRHYLRCGECDRPLTSQYSFSEHSGRYEHYFCYNPKCSQRRKTFQKAKLENAFSTYIAQIKPTQELIDRFNERFLNRYKLREQDLNGEYFRKADEIQQLKKDLQWVIDQGKAGIFKGETLRSQVASTESKLELAEMSLTNTHLEKIDVQLVLDYGESFIQTVEKVWYDAPSEYKRKIQRFIMPGAAAVAKNGKEYTFSNPKIGRFFELIELVGTDESNVVARLGFEPRYYPPEG